MRGAGVRVARALVALALVVACAGCGANVAVDGSSGASTGGGGSSDACAANVTLGLEGGMLGATVGPLELSPAPTDVCITFQGQVANTFFEATSTPFPAADAIRLDIKAADGTVLVSGSPEVTAGEAFELLQWQAPEGVQAVVLVATATPPATASVMMTFLVPR